MTTGCKERDVVVLLRIVDAESQRHLVEERRAARRRPLDGEVLADAEHPLIHTLLEGLAAKRRPVKAAVAISHEVADDNRRRARVAKVAQRDRQAGGRAAMRRVEHVARQLARRRRRGEEAQAHPRDLADLCDALGQLHARRVAHATPERVEDDPLRRVTHGEDEWEAKLGLVRVVERGKLGVLLGRELREAGALLLLGRLGGQATRDRGLPREVGVRAQQAELLRLRRRRDDRPERLVDGRERVERAGGVRALGDPRRALVHGP
eukprot:CAMPEP_0180061526 /NCGR_PEP_ID=MMETSP0985-20121206/6631_1 /TAXON_ID=483367 /ORGANISM="non described non described, Strain CCMP 2436" /LENGTH=264 /DNA_ID=CAMNT_0021991639 /DNA_START=222 /DNA_END=1014 /DNA_ORIENTATION=+